MVAEDPESGVRAVVRDVKREWVGRRPRIIVEYEASGRVETFYFTWGVKEGVRADVKLN